MKVKTLTRDEFFRWDMQKVRELIAEAKACDGDVLKPICWTGFGYGSGFVTRIAKYKNGKRVDNANQRKLWENNEDLG